VLIGWLAYLLVERGRMGPEIDQANLREWLDEARPFRKTLPDLVREYAPLVVAGQSDLAQTKAAEIDEQLSAMTDPTRMFPSQLPLFPELYRLEVALTQAPEGSKIVWDSPVPRPRRQNSNQIQELTHPVTDAAGKMVGYVRCEYRLHAFNKLQRDERQRQAVTWVAAAVALGGSVLALAWVYLFLRRERRRELAQLESEKALEHAEVVTLNAKIQAREAEREAEELQRQMMQQRIEAATAQARAAEAEKKTIEVQSQLYAGIGIMAGSYAHNIKNLLVRPNDLLARCLETPDLPAAQSTMLGEVQATLATVTERLQMILKTVRRDPTNAEMTVLDLNALIAETGQTWTTIANEKWKMHLHTTPAPTPLRIRGDLAHLQQAIENLVFNARDATFEMRNHLRDTARDVRDAAKRRQALIDAASWRGEVTVRGSADAAYAILEVSDTGIGMTPDVRAKCLETHFSTKRDNALYEGYNAGMGLGLSFVAMVLEHHHAELTITSTPLHGATFRIRFPLVTE
jgi:signal transduction histidine kinase